ncbi:MAG: hypothetical protein WCG78_03195 [Candidatus Omnitrophota bacterium]
MFRYETVIRIISEGCDRLDAGDKAGAIIDSAKITDDLIVHCEPTRLYREQPVVHVPIVVCGRYLVEA